MLKGGSKVNDIRKLIADNSVSDYSDLYRLLFDEVNVYAPDHEPECILAIAAGQQQDVHVVDKEINFVSTIIKLKHIPYYKSIISDYNVFQHRHEWNLYNKLTGLTFKYLLNIFFFTM